MPETPGGRRRNLRRKARRDYTATMRVFLLNPSSPREIAAGAYSQSMLPMAPRGLAGLAAVAEAAGHQTYAEDQYASRRSAAQIVRFVVNHQVDVLGIGCLSPNLPMVEALARGVKQARPQTHIVLGNSHASYFAAELLRTLPIDSVVRGEGEAAFGQLLAALDAGRSLAGIAGLAYRDGDEVTSADPAPQLQDLDSLPRPAWHLLNIQDYQAPPRLLFRGPLGAVEASRGCPNRCSYCSQYLWTPKVARRKMVNVVNEIEWLYEEFGLRNVGFVDGIFPLNKKDGLAFARLMRERELPRKMQWFSTVRIDTVDRELLIALKDAGCLFLLYGFESGSERLLRDARKQQDPRQAFAAMRLTKEVGLLAYGVFMIGFPHETEEEAKVTIQFSLDLDCDVASFARVTPYPGTPLYEQYKDTFPPDLPWRQFNNQYRPAPGEAMWRLPGLSHAQINALLRRAMLRFYLRPRLIVRHLRLGLFTWRELLQGAAMLAGDLLTRLRGGERR